MRYLERFHTVGNILRPFENKEIGNEVKKDRTGTNQSIIGVYEVISSHLIAIYSYKGRNYLFFKNSTVEITYNIRAEYYIPQNKKEETILKLFDKGVSILNVKFKNLHDPVIWPFEIDEDWNSVNFAYYLAKYINKVKENPDIVLFPGK